jgi:monoamine oxidase
MAGLAAARALQARQVEVLVVEAASRIGGRALSDTTSLGGVFDCGAGWLHATAKNPLVPLAVELGLRVEPLALRERVYREPSGWLASAEQAEWEDFRERTYAAIGESAAAGRDVAVSQVLNADTPYWRLLEGWFVDDEGTPPDMASTLDIAAYCDTGEHARLYEGLGTLVRQYAEGVPVRRGVRVARLEWSDAGVTLDTTHGRIDAAAAIVTVSTAVLQRGDITFVPRLPPTTQAAIDALPLSTYEKLGMRLEGPPLVDQPAWVLSLADDISVAFEVQIERQPRVIAYLNGPRIAGRAPAALWTVARERLSATFGARAAAQVVAWRSTAWNSNALIGGSYSYARPGQAGARDVLAEPLHDRLYFAGEACSRTAYGTLHGAYRSGQAAAERLALKVFA